MSRYIDIEPIEKQIEFELTTGQCKTFSEREKGVLNIYDAIKNAPTADVEEVRYGEWLENGANYKCSRCGNTEPYYTDSYCRVCGARMYEEKKK